ncbi:glycosyltransferase family protein [Bacteroides sp. 519]|uniref:glycosyltransferase family protein n=1 Tax=Bacteroides sp. 519 TaxID=2302937 RepID=UPI0013D48C9B|nr:glycosyltransferase family protein [Bacteroides sp. 519]NDV58600.1 glycosyltransferase [Bacteroides sp. 519]
MKFLFVVQGEGREHCSQALALEEILLRNGHDVVEILVGKSSYKPLPGFFNRDVQSPVKWFLSPNILPAPGKSWWYMSKKMFLSVLDIPEYVRSMRYIYQRIVNSEADMVLNFYEPLSGLLYGFMPQSIPSVCIGHEYLYLNRELALDINSPYKLSFLRFLTSVTCMGSSKCLGLSVEEVPDDWGNRIAVVPPLLRQEIMSLQPEKAEKGDFVHGYLGRNNQIRPLMEFHTRHPEIPMHLFRKKRDAIQTCEIDKSLFLHQFDEINYLNYLAECKISVNTGSYESICETMYLGKPFIIMPGNIIQKCNAFLAACAGGGTIAVGNTHEPLLYLKNSEVQHQNFVKWVNKSEQIILQELEEVRSPKKAFSFNR